MAKYVVFSVGMLSVCVVLLYGFDTVNVQQARLQARLVELDGRSQERTEELRETLNRRMDALEARVDAQLAAYLANEFEREDQRADSATETPPLEEGGSVEVPLAVPPTPAGLLGYMDLPPEERDSHPYTVFDFGINGQPLKVILHGEDGKPVIVDASFAPLAHAVIDYNARKLEVLCEEVREKFIGGEYERSTGPKDGHREVILPSGDIVSVPSGECSRMVKAAGDRLADEKSAYKRLMRELGVTLVSFSGGQSPRAK